MISTKKRLLAAAVVISLLTIFQVRADDETADLRRLKRASQLVLAKKAAEIAEATGQVEKGIPALETLGLDRFYRTGDRWRVLFSAKSKSFYRMVPLTGMEVDGWTRPIAYDFEVVRVGTYTARGGTTRRYAEIAVTIADPRLAAALRSANAPTRITLTLNDLYRGVVKTYHFPRPREDGTQQVTYSLDGRRNISSSLDRFPLDIPNVSRADGIPASQSPTLPEPLRASLGRAQVLDPSQSLTFSYKNTYGRRLDVAWSRGGLWPVYTSSDAGVAVLVSQERNR
jgi:hypothetical protein